MLNCYTTNRDDLNDNSKRSSKEDVIFTHQLREAVIRLNPSIPEATIESALNQLTDKCKAMSVIAANKEIDSLIRDGIPVEYENSEGKKEHAKVQVVDFDNYQFEIVVKKYPFLRDKVTVMIFINPGLEVSNKRLHSSNDA